MTGTKPKHKVLSEPGLTSIHSRIHCAATQDEALKPSEVDEVMVISFIETLVEVAEAVAKRRQQRMKMVE